MDKDKIRIVKLGDIWYLGTDEGELGVQMLKDIKSNELICFNTKGEAEKFIENLQ